MIKAKIKMTKEHILDLSLNTTNGFLQIHQDWQSRDNILRMSKQLMTLMTILLNVKDL